MRMLGALRDLRDRRFLRRSFEGELNCGFAQVQLACDGVGEHAGAAFMHELALAASDFDAGIKVGGGLIEIGGMAVCST